MKGSNTSPAFINYNTRHIATFKKEKLKHKDKYIIFYGVPRGTFLFFPFFTFHVEHFKKSVSQFSHID